MTRFLIILILVFFLYILVRGLLTSGRKTRSGSGGGAVDELVQDPICKTYVPLHDSEKRVHGGRTYHFCSKACAEEFEKARKRGSG